MVFFNWKQNFQPFRVLVMFSQLSLTDTQCWNCTRVLRFSVGFRKLCTKSLPLVVGKSLTCAFYLQLPTQYYTAVVWTFYQSFVLWNFTFCLSEWIDVYRNLLQLYTVTSVLLFGQAVFYRFILKFSKRRQQEVWNYYTYETSFSLADRLAFL